MAVAAVRDAPRTLHRFVRRRTAIASALVFYGNGASVVDADARRPRVRQGPRHGRHSQHPAGRQHGDGRGPLSWLGRTAVGPQRPAVRTARHRALHRRRLEQRSRASTERASANSGGLRTWRLPGWRAPIPTTRRTPTRRSRVCTIRRPVRQTPRSLRMQRTLELDIDAPQVPWLPLTSFHTHHRSGGIPTSFPLQSNTLKVDGVAQSRGVACGTATPARGDTPPRSSTSTTRRATSSRSSPTPRASDARGDYRSASTRSAWASSCRCQLGTLPEKSESMLMRVANDAERRLDRNPTSSKASTTSRETEATSPGVPGAAEPDHPSDQVATLRFARR